MFSCVDQFGKEYYCRSGWYDWGRWVLLGVIIVTTILFFFLFRWVLFRFSGHQPLLTSATAVLVLVVASAWELSRCTVQAGQQLHSAMDQQPTIQTTNNKRHQTMSPQITNREGITEQIRATLGVSRRALSLGNQKMPTVAGIQSIRLQQDLPQRKTVMESSDKESHQLCMSTTNI